MDPTRDDPVLRFQSEAAAQDVGERIEMLRQLYRELEETGRTDGHLTALMALREHAAGNTRRARPLMQRCAEPTEQPKKDSVKDSVSVRDSANSLSRWRHENEPRTKSGCMRNTLTRSSLFIGTAAAPLTGKQFGLSGRL